jgi:hypothetical protein
MILQGCYDKIWEDTLGNTAIMVGSLVGVAVFQVSLKSKAYTLI